MNLFADRKASGPSVCRLEIFFVLLRILLNVFFHTLSEELTTTRKSSEGTQKTYFFRSICLLETGV